MKFQQQKTLKKIEAMDLKINIAQKKIFIKVRQSKTQYVLAN